MDYRPEHILTDYLFEMIFIERSRMCEGSYGGLSNKFDEGNTMNREATSGLLLATSSSVVANS